MGLLEIRGLTKRFPMRCGALQRTRGWVQAVDGVDFDLSAGECLALVGESGSGKSTVARCITRLIEPSGGEIHFDGHDLAAMSDAELRPRRRHMQIVFQDPYGSLNPRMKVGEALAEPLEIHDLEPREGRQERVEELLRWTGLAPDDARRFPHELSGGQRQRVAIARALACRPKLLVADEPVSSLDVSVQAQIVNLLIDLQKRLGLSLLLIAHDLALVEQIADRLAVMYFGRIVESGPTERVLSAPQHPYTVSLLNAASSALGRSPSEAATGEIPSHLSPPPGCSFEPRCAVARSPCSSDAPALINLGDGHRVACHYSGELNPGGCAGVSRMEQSAGESVV